MMDHNELILTRAAGVADRKPNAMMPEIWTLVPATIDLRSSRGIWHVARLGEFNSTKQKIN